MGWLDTGCHLLMRFIYKPNIDLIFNVFFLYVLVAFVISCKFFIEENQLVFCALHMVGSYMVTESSIIVYFCLDM